MSRSAARFLVLGWLYVASRNCYIVDVRFHLVLVPENMYLSIINFALYCLLSALSHVEADSRSNGHGVYVRSPAKNPLLGSGWNIAGVTDSKLAKILANDMENYHRMWSDSRTTAPSSIII